ncbi:MAG: endonuclease/exonuclease/phosphatase family protein [Candidatus Sericytochromatia bacterium]
MEKPGKPVDVEVLSLNTWLRPSPIGTDRVERAERIGKSLPEYEIVGLQETFSDDSEVIGQTAKAQGSHPYGYRQDKGGFLTSNSGLTTLSKYEILEKDFKPFSYSSGTDSLSRKGITFSRIEVPGVGPVDVYNTHYQAGSSPELPWSVKALNWMSPLTAVLPLGLSKQQIRLTQNQELEAFIDQHDRGNPVLVTGDFNSQPDSPVYKDLLARTGLKDSYREVHGDQPGYTSDATLNPHLDADEGRETLDYVFYRPGKTVDVRAEASELTHTEPIDGMFVSDHFGVHSRLRFEAKAS